MKFPKFKEDDQRRFEQSFTTSVSKGCSHKKKDNQKRTLFLMTVVLNTLGAFIIFSYFRVQINNESIQRKFGKH